MSELRQISEDIVARLNQYQPYGPKATTLTKLSHWEIYLAALRRTGSGRSMSWGTALKPRMKQSRCGLWEVRDFDCMFHGETQVEAYRHWLYATTREAMDKVVDR